MGMDTLSSDGAAPTAALPDEEIVRCVRAGDSALFEILMRRHNQRVYRVVRAVVKDEADVDDDRGEFMDTLTSPEADPER
jgi:RNA polymerase sigma-70 factor, ECF subfamily